MKTSTSIAVWIGVSSVAILAAISAYQLFTSISESEELTDKELVWCDANRSLVALAAESLGLLPDDLAERPVDVVGDDVDPIADLSDDTALDIYRQLRELSAEAPPQQFGDIGFPTEEEFETAAILGARSAADASSITSRWLDDLDDGWNHVDAQQSCAAAFAAFTGR